MESKEILHGRLFVLGGRPTDWPILAGKVPWSEPRGKVVQDMKFWLQECHGQVTVALSKGNLKIAVNAHTREDRLPRELIQL